MPVAGTENLPRFSEAKPAPPVSSYRRPRRHWIVASWMTVRPGSGLGPAGFEPGTRERCPPLRAGLRIAVAPPTTS